jgi:hypothetical protein
MFLNIHFVLDGYLKYTFLNSIFPFKTSQQPDYNGSIEVPSSIIPKIVFAADFAFETEGI